MTPLRASGGQRAGAGCVVLGASDVSYLDGSEADIERLVLRSTDRGDMSDELHLAAHTWAERYHLSAARANVLRSLRFERTWRVLEIGAGCGAISRFLGEHSGLVDAVEPVTRRAATARARTADLHNVEVFIGDLSHVPDEPAYDLVVLVGVLEWIASGADDHASYVAFLEACRRRVVEGGHVVCAIENRLGVKYLCGSPEDHSQRPYDGIEGYPHGTPARTFDRQTLTSLFESAGLRTDVLAAFPDYKMTRALLSDALFRHPTARDLAWRIPEFPSPDRGTDSRRSSDERRAWRSLVEAGLGPEFGNSFLVIGHAGHAGRDRCDRIWPAARLAAYSSAGVRRAAFATLTTVVDGPAVSFIRTRLSDERVESPFRLLTPTEAFVEGVDLLEGHTPSNVPALVAALSGWRDLVTQRTPTDGAAPIDLIPRNLIAGTDGRLHAIDQEWLAHGFGRADVIARGILSLAGVLGEHADWSSPGARRRLDVLDQVAAGLGAEPGWLARALSVEREVLGHVRNWSPEATAAWQRDVLAHLSAPLQPRGGPARRLAKRVRRLVPRG